MSDTHEAWVDRCARWEKLYYEKCAEVEALRAALAAHSPLTPVTAEHIDRWAAAAVEGREP